MTYLTLFLCLALGYMIGLLQSGINIHINDNTPKVEYDKDGKPKYNESISALTEEEKEWIVENRR